MLESMIKTPKTHILLCDDDVNATSVLADFLRDKGYEVIIAHDGEDCLRKLSGDQCDICLLDVTMPKLDGFETLNTMRKSNLMLPVVMMMETNSQQAIVRAYGLGCDDYVVKPLSVELLICKIEAILRRFRPSTMSQETEFDLDGLHFDSVRQTLNGTHLSARENDLLLLLCQNMNAVVDRHVILRSLWQADNHFAVRSLCVYINHLRHFLQGTDVQIVSVHGRGYKLVNSKSS